MRVAAWGLAAIVAAIALALNAAARADQPDESSPFPSPSPTSSAGPGSGGYAVFGIAALSASGGQTASTASPAPTPFGSTRATGYSIELMGRLSPTYVSTLRYEDANLHGGDSSVETRFDVALMYQFVPTHAAVGIGYASLQRSTFSASSNGLGAGVTLLPDLSRRVSPYGSAFVYPSLLAPDATRSGLTVLRLGIAIAPPKATSFFARVGFETQHFGAPSFAPSTLSGVELGLGTSF